MNKTLRIIIFFYLNIIFIVNAQEKGIIKFSIKDRANISVENCLLFNLSTNGFTFTDKEGIAYLYCKIDDKVKISHVSFKDTLFEVSSVKMHRIILKKEFYKIGGIEIIANRSLVNIGDITKTEITSADLEHYQATSLGDIIGLVPGINYTGNPGINKTSQVAIRGEFDKINSLSSFGTSIQLDGLVVSNNTNMQYEALTGGKFGTGNLLGSADLRTIPADFIKRVEVIRGLPSVEYNDFLTGIIKVESKDEEIPFRFKLKDNPDLKEATLYGAVKWNGSLLSLKANIAHSERDKRIEGDEYSRYSGSIVLSNRLDSFDYFKTDFTFQFLDDSEEPKGDYLKVRNYNKGYNLGLSNRAKYNFNESTSLDYIVGIRAKRKNTFRSKIIQTGGIILETGDTISTYTGKLENKGVELTVNSKINLTKRLISKNTTHKLLAGIEAKIEGNFGQGIKVDSVFNYYGYHSSRRSYSFKNLPLLNSFGFYFEDLINGKFLVNYLLRLGIRFDNFSYNSSRNISGIFENSNFDINPRINLVLYPSNSLALRFTAGKSSKMPPLFMLKPAKEYFHRRIPDENKNLVLKLDKQNLNLKTIKQNMFELGIDKTFMNDVGLSLSLYYNYRYDIPELNEFPFIYQNNNDVNYLGTYGKYLNSGKYYSNGAEISIKTVTFKKYNISFDYSFSFSRYRTGGNKLDYKRYPEIEKGQLPNFHYQNGEIDTLIGGHYQTVKYKRESLWNTLKISYKIKDLGLWLTFNIHHYILGRSKYFNFYNYDINKLTEEERKINEFNSAWKEEPQKFLLNVNVSKSIGKNGELSLFVNNLLDDKAVWRREIYPGIYSEAVRNPELFYGFEFSYVF